MGKLEKVVKGEAVLCMRFFSNARLVASAIDRGGMGPKRLVSTSATAPLGIVSFRLTPQDHRRRIPATFRSVYSECRSNLISGDRMANESARNALRSMRGESVQYLPGWTVQCINPECAARGHWLRVGSSNGEFCCNCSAPLHNVPPPLAPRLRMRPRSLGSYRPSGRPSGRSR